MNSAAQTNDDSARMDIILISVEYIGKDFNDPDSPVVIIRTPEQVSRTTEHAFAVIGVLPSNTTSDGDQVVLDEFSERADALKWAYQSGRKSGVPVVDHTG